MGGVADTDWEADLLKPSITSCRLNEIPVDS